MKFLFSLSESSLFVKFVLLWFFPSDPQNYDQKTQRQPVSLSLSLFLHSFFIVSQSCGSTGASQTSERMARKFQRRSWASWARWNCRHRHCLLPPKNTSFPSSYGSLAMPTSRAIWHAVWHGLVDCASSSHKDGQRSCWGQWRKSKAKSSRHRKKTMLNSSLSPITRCILPSSALCKDTNMEKQLVTWSCRIMRILWKRIDCFAFWAFTADISIDKPWPFRLRIIRWNSVLLQRKTLNISR